MKRFNLDSLIIFKFNFFKTKKLKLFFYCCQHIDESTQVCQAFLVLAGNYNQIFPCMDIKVIGQSGHKRKSLRTFILKHILSCELVYSNEGTSIWGGCLA